MKMWILRLNVKLILTFALFYIFPTQLIFSQGSWLKIQTPTHHNLKSIFFIDSLKGWIAGDSGIILQTKDGGNTWLFQQSNVTTTIHDLFFLDSLNGWGLTWHRNFFGPIGTTILKTTNGGLNWSSYQYPRELVFFYSIIFNDLMNGWVCGYPGSILRTRNGGTEWDEVKFLNVQFSEFPIYKLKFINENYGIGVGGVIDIFGVIWRTTDGGEFWNAFPIGPEPINDFQIINEDFVFAVGGDYEYGTAVSHSTDKGLNWDYRTLDIFGIANSVAFRNANEGWLNLKGERKFLVTIDSGKTWSEYLTPDSVQPNKIIFVDSLHGYSVCDSGYFLKYIPKIHTSIKEKSDIAYLTKETIDVNVFPNPANSSAKIQIELKSSSHLTVEIFSIIGEKIKTLTNNDFEAGTYYFNIDVNQLQSGIYFIKASKGNHSKIKKFIVVK